jgi:hypothetical protein
MIKKEEVIAKLEAFKAYSIAHTEEKQIEYDNENGNYENYYTSMINSAYNAVNTYFNTHNPEFDSVLKLVVFNMYCHTWDINAMYDDDLERGINKNIPMYYNDLREIYYKFPILSLSEEEFFNSWIYGEEPSEGEETGIKKPIIPLSNPHLTTLRTDLNGTVTVNPDGTETANNDDAQSLELSRLKGLLNWLENTSDLSLVELLEESGTLIKSLSTQEIGTIIYRDRGVKEIITNKGYNIYIPTYMRG